MLYIHCFPCVKMCSHFTNSYFPGCKVWKFKSLDPPDLPLPDNIPLNYLKDGEEIGTEGATLRQDKMSISFCVILHTHWCRTWPRNSIISLCVGIV